LLTTVGILAFFKIYKIMLLCIRSIAKSYDTVTVDENY